MYQYQLLDPETKLPNGKVWQTHKSPAEIKKGQSRMEVDYSALEMRVMAALPEKERERWMSGGKARDLYRSSRMFMLDDAHQVDPDMLERLLQRDPHAEMAARIFEVPPGDVSKAQRQSAQAVGFAALYGRHQNAKGPF